jgi:beta-glucosidase
MKIKSIVLVGIAVLGVLSSFAATRSVVPAAWNGDPNCWQMRRHNGKMKEVAAGGAPVVFIGDSITHYWAGAKSIGSKDDFATKKEWLDCFGDIPSLNMGYGFDRTQNVIWRLENGELRNIKPELVIVLIGINNFATTKKFKANTPEETADGIRKILDLVNKFSPKSKILLLGTLPSFGPESSHRKNGEKLNKILSGFDKENNYKGKLTYLDFGKEFLDENGMIKAGLTRDKLHPTKKGYEIFAKNFKPFLKNIKIKKSHR